jgi:hypothetical protein
LVATVTSGANGDLAFNIKLPASAPAGSVYSLAVSVGTFQDAKTFTLAAAPVDSAALPNTGSTDTGSVALPTTGVDAAPYVWFGGGLLLLGAGLITVLAFVRRSRENA